MSGVWGNKIKLSIFGESHGRAIGINIDGLKPGFEINLSHIEFEMSRRSPGKNELSTSRNEEDSFEILSGFFNGKTTGTPLCAVIYNKDKRSGDYSELKDKIRPSHADYTGYIKYNGFNDYRGGGHFSGRLTAPLVFAGAVCRQYLKAKGIIIGSHIKRVGEVEDESFDKLKIEDKTLIELSRDAFPVLNKEKGEEMKRTIIHAREEKDSVGGIIEGVIVNLPPGLGNPFFDSVESTLSHLLFSIPGVKGVEFGEGFEIARMKGSEANDEYYIEKDEIKTSKNSNGGILGGITNGMPLVFRTALKPTASIGRLQNTVDIGKMENTTLNIQGRHDPCIVTRAIPVVEACAAIAILDLI